MQKITITLILALVFLAGCDTIRFAPTEIQKQNAYLHQRTAKLSADTAQAESASTKLKALADLSHLQSKSFTTYFGLPSQLPAADAAEDVLSGAGLSIANQSLIESAERPDPWLAADALLELGIGISAILGGVYGTKAVKFLKDARTKTEALKEVIKGNELFKKHNPASVNAFKQAQQSQSPQTKTLVTEMKS
jgi:hypothetical protein